MNQNLARKIIGFVLAILFSQIAISATLIGEISLPSGQVAKGTIHNEVRLCSYDSFGGYLGCDNFTATIFNEENSAGYLINYVPAPDGGEYQLSTYCSSNCTEYVSNFQYMQSDGTTTFTPARVAELPEAPNFILDEGSSIEVTIRLPNAQTSTQNIYNQVNLCVIDKDGGGLGCTYTDVLIPANTASVSQKFRYLQAPAGGSYELSTSCNGSCSDYVDDYQYLQADGSTSFIPARTESLPNTISFTLDQGQRLNGNITLENGGITESNISSEVSLCRYNQDGNYIDCDYVYRTLAQGNSSVNYWFNFLPVPSGGSYRLSTRCYSNCEGYVTNHQYLQEDGSLAFTESSISNLPETQNFALSSGEALTGLIKLPDGKVANGEIRNQVVLCQNDEMGYSKSCLSYYAVIPSNSNSISYQFNFVPGAANESYTLSTACTSNCSGYVNNAQYLQPDGTISFISANILTLPSVRDFTLDPGQSLSGLIKLPESEVTPYDFRNQIYLCMYGPNQSFIDCKYSSADILEGTSEAAYSFNFVPVPTGGSYQLYSDCYNDCVGYVPNTQYLQIDGTTGFTNTLVPTVPNTLDFVLDPGQSLTGEIKLPASELANVYIYNHLRLCLYDEQGLEIRCGSDYSVIEPNSSSIGYTFNFLPIPNGGEYELSVICTEPCGDYVSERQYHQADGSNTFLESRTPTIPEIHDFILDKGQVISGRIKLPTGKYAPSSIYNHVSFCRYNDSGYLMSCAYRSVLIFIGSNSSRYSFNYIPLPGDGYYSLSSYCGGQCETYSIDTQYLQADGSTSLVPSQITNLPTEHDFILYEVLTPDSYEPDNAVAQAKPINSYQRQFRSIHEPGDVDWIKFELEAEQDISLKAVNLGDEGNPKMTLFTRGLTAIQNHDDVIDDQELANSNIATINVKQLAAGKYLIKIEAYSPTALTQLYSITYQGPKTDDFCTIVRASNGNLVPICL